jgi:hypothetical protein
MRWCCVAIVAATAVALGSMPVSAPAAPAAAGTSRETIATLTEESPLSGGQGWLVWSWLEEDSWRLIAYHAGRESVVPIRPRPEPFDATVGSDIHGRAVVTFSRCNKTPRMTGTRADSGGMLEIPRTGRGCSIRVVDLVSGRESLVPIPRALGDSDTTPAMWHGVVAFARMEPRHGLVSQVLAWSPHHPAALLSLPHGFVPERCPYPTSCKGFFGSGEVQALAFDGSLVSFVWEPKESLASGPERWEYRVDTVSTQHGRVVGEAGTSESCTTFAPVEEAIPGTPFLIGGTAYFSAVQRGNCYRRYGSGLLVARPHAQLEATLSTPIIGWAFDGHSTYELVSQRPAEHDDVEAACTTEQPCALKRHALPPLAPARNLPTHAR